MVKIPKNSAPASKRLTQKEKKHVKNAEKEGVQEKKKPLEESSLASSQKVSKDLPKKEKIPSTLSLKEGESEMRSEGSKKKSGVIFLWFLGMVMLVLMGALYWDATQEGKNVSSVSSEVSDLASTQETLEMRIKKLEESQVILRTQLEKTTLLEKDFVQSQGQMAALNGRLNAVESRNPQVILPEASLLAKRSASEQAQLRQLEDRVSEIEKTLFLKNKAGQEGLKVMQLFSNLQQALLAGNSFEEELKLFSNEVDITDEQLQNLLKSLKPLASEGVSTPVDLYLLFPNVADKISTVLRPEPQNFKEKILMKIKNLVSVRRIKGGDLTKETSDGALVNVEQMLGYGDLKRALETLKKMDLKGEEMALSWMAKAQQYLEAQKVLQDIEDHIFGSAFGEIKGVRVKESKGSSQGVSQ